MAGPFLNGTTAQCLFDAAKTANLGLSGNPDGQQGLVVDPATCGSNPPANNAPSASFSDSCTDLSCSFTDGSSDSDGSVVSWAWNFGDGSTSSAQNPSHSYGAAGTYTVSLTVTDDDGASNSTSSSVTVSDGSTGGGDVTLGSVSAYKVKGKKRWDYSWSGATSSSVDIYLDGSIVATTANDGTYTLVTNGKGGGTHSHMVCEAGTTTCSDSVTTIF
ncbi:PKD domain-containing protein [uncultured Lentibacter sp.]|uniref:PKD domain-containing protein n=1 Tax=uncultured Lentibacter sp. TaxID=1659309 RepID=UPI002611255D|nr:PKD domain-containing protein [uncultured Lentibacter sp.]